MTDYRPSTANTIGPTSALVQPSPGNPHTFNPENEQPQFVSLQGNSLGRSPQAIEGVGRAPQVVVNEYAESYSGQQQQIDRSSSSPNSNDAAALPPYTPLSPVPVDATMSSSLSYSQPYLQPYSQAQQQIPMPYPTYSEHQSHMTLVNSVTTLTPNPDQSLATDYSPGINGTYAPPEPKLVDTAYTPETYLSSPRKRTRKVLCCFCFCFVAVALAIVLGIIFGVVRKNDDRQKDTQHESIVPSIGSKTTSTRPSASRTFAWSTTITTTITTTAATFNQCSNTCTTREKSCEASCGGDKFECGWNCSKEASDCRFSCHSDSSSCSLEC
ncbi:hypothetical protein BGZ51_006103 [Haplosporangium sp. Z 767]|nr:hypothetical protein BGZ51_006103 [Haplosporangium sp. Z 767]